MEIKDWLQSDRDYNIGVDLYGKYGLNGNYKRLFARGKTYFTNTLLVQELQRIYELLDKPAEIDGPVIENVELKVSTKAEDFARVAEPKHQPIDVSKLPPELQKLNIHKGRLYQQASHLHSKIELLSNEQERMAAAKQIVENFEEMDAIWAKLDYWQEHGVLMPETKPKIFDPEAAKPHELIAYRNNLRAHISKLKRNPARVDDLVKKQAELGAIEIKIRSL